MDGDVGRARIGGGKAWNQIRRLKEDVLCIAASTSKWGNCLKKREEAIADGVVGTGFVEVATVEEVVAVGVR